MSLEEQVEQTFSELNISEINRQSVRNYLEVLKRKDKETYEHSARVGLLGVRVAGYMHLNPKILFFAGALHDIGKLLVLPETLRKKVGFDEKDMEQLRKHSYYTYSMLRGVHEYSAEIALRHHQYQEKGYPKKLPRMRIGYSQATRAMIPFYARILSLIDFYDAATTRENDKFGEVRKLSRDEVRALMLKENTDVASLVEDLFKSNIF